MGKLVINKLFSPETCFECNMIRESTSCCTAFNKPLESLGDSFKRLTECKHADLSYRICKNCRFFDYQPYVASICNCKKPETMCVVRSTPTFGCNFWEPKEA